MEFAGAVLRPHAYLMDEKEEKPKKVRKSLEQTGYELIKKGKISQNLLEYIRQPLISEEEYRNRIKQG